MQRVKVVLAFSLALNIVLAGLIAVAVYAALDNYNRIKASVEAITASAGYGGIGHNLTISAFPPMVEGAIWVTSEIRIENGGEFDIRNLEVVVFVEVEESSDYSRWLGKVVADGEVWIGDVPAGTSKNTTIRVYIYEEYLDQFAFHDATLLVRAFVKLDYDIVLSFAFYSTPLTVHYEQMVEQHLAWNAAGA